MTDRGKMQIHPSQRLTVPDGTQVDIDHDMVPLIRALWSLNLKTTGSCQDFGEGTAGQRALSRNPEPYGGDAFIAFYTGYAWIEMPVPAALHLARMLVGTEFHDAVTRRWTPGSWRMHVPIISGQDSSIDLSLTAQVHFPREQIGSLTSVLGSMRRPAA